MHFGLSTPHGELETTVAKCNTLQITVLSTPHGELETRLVMMYFVEVKHLSTPHGELETNAPIECRILKSYFQLHTVN